MTPADYSSVLRLLPSADVEVIKDILAAYFARPKHERPRDLVTVLFMSVLMEELKARVAALQQRADATRRLSS